MDDLEIKILSNSNKDVITEFDNKIQNVKEDIDNNLKQQIRDI